MGITTLVADGLGHDLAGVCLALEMTTLAPCAAMASAMARPMPRLDPVTMATFPVRSNICILP